MCLPPMLAKHFIIRNIPIIFTCPIVQDIFRINIKYYWLFNIGIFSTGGLCESGSPCVTVHNKKKNFWYV